MSISFDAILAEKNDALHASFVKLYAPLRSDAYVMAASLPSNDYLFKYRVFLRRLQSMPMSEKTVAVRPPDMTLICPNASTADFARKLVLLTLLLKVVSL